MYDGFILSIQKHLVSTKLDMSIHENTATEKPDSFSIEISDPIRDFDQNYYQLFLDQQSDTANKNAGHSWIYTGGDEGDLLIGYGIPPSNRTYIIGDDIKIQNLSQAFNTSLLPIYPEVPIHNPIEDELELIDIPKISLSRQLILRPKTNKCIVLDLDETLVHTMRSMTSLKNLGIFSFERSFNTKNSDIRSRCYQIDLYDVFKPGGTGRETKVWGVTRPYLREFLIFCFSYFSVVAVWSAGQKKYVHEIVDLIFRDIAMPHIVFTYPDCVPVKNGLQKHLSKPLYKMYKQCDSHQPSKSISSNIVFSGCSSNQHMGPTKTYVIDDRFDTFSSNILNGIQIPAYKPAPDLKSISQDDQTLKKLMRWFQQEKVVNSEDIRMLDKGYIFLNK